MKKYRFLILLICLLAFAVCVSAQSMIGYSISEIKAKHTDKTFTLDYSSDGLARYSTKFSLGTFVYFMDNAGVCESCAYFMDEPENINILVSIFNNKYVIISDTKWKVYNTETILTIVLNTAYDGTKYFGYYLE